MGDDDAERSPVVLGPSDGRRYDMGRIVAVFKADGAETAGGYSISEDDVFYVLDGTMSVRAGDRWIDAAKGAFVLVPGGVVHDFENRGDVRAGVLNLSHPGEFERRMPGIVEWFARHPAGDTAPAAG